MSVLVDIFRHNTWATLGLLELCRGLSAEQRSATCPGTYGTVQATLRHLIEAEERYYEGLAGERVGEPLPEDADPDLLSQRARELGSRWEALAAEPGPSGREIVHPAGVAQAGAVFVQVIHHGNEHRAQVKTILSATGMQPPELDSWAQAFEEGRLRFHGPPPWEAGPE